MSTPCVVTFSVAGDGVIVTGSQGISVWNRRNYETRSFGQKHQDWGSCLALSADGRTLATEHTDGTVRLCNIKTGDVKGLSQTHEDTLEGLDFSPDGSLLITAGWDETCKLRDHATGQLTRVIHTPPHCEDATFAPDVRSRFPRRTML
jgi:WD40 repeat protein